MKVLVVIPAYNEEDSIENAVNSVVNYGYDYVVINDGSCDNTAEICRRNKYNYLDLKENLGIGGAVQAGHKYAYARGYDVDVQFDGDGQHDAGYIGVLVEKVKSGSDLVIGSRFLEPGDGFKSTFMRRVGIKWLCGSIRLASGLKVTDPTSGFRATGSKALELFCRDYPADYPEPESIVAAKKAGLDISEVQVVMHERQGGSSSIRPLSSVYYMIKVTLAVFLVGLGRRRR